MGVPAAQRIPLVNYWWLTCIQRLNSRKYCPRCRSWTPSWWWWWTRTSRRAASRSGRGWGVRPSFWSPLTACAPCSARLGPWGLLLWKNTGWFKCTVRIVLKCKNNKEGGLTRSKSYLKLLSLQPTSDAGSFGYKSRLFNFWNYMILYNKLDFRPLLQRPWFIKQYYIGTQLQLFIWLGLVVQHYSSQSCFQYWARGV